MKKSCDTLVFQFLPGFSKTTRKPKIDMVKPNTFATSVVTIPFCQVPVVVWIPNGSPKMKGIGILGKVSRFESQTTKRPKPTSQLSDSVRNILRLQADTFPSLGTELITVFTRTCNMVIERQVESQVVSINFWSFKLRTTTDWWTTGPFFFREVSSSKLAIWKKKLPCFLCFLEAYHPKSPECFPKRLHLRHRIERSQRSKRTEDTEEAQTGDESQKFDHRSHGMIPGVLVPLQRDWRKQNVFRYVETSLHHWGVCDQYPASLKKVDYHQFQAFGDDVENFLKGTYSES